MCKLNFVAAANVNSPLFGCGQVELANIGAVHDRRNQRKQDACVREMKKCLS